MCDENKFPNSDLTMEFLYLSVDIIVHFNMAITLCSSPIGISERRTSRSQNSELAVELKTIFDGLFRKGDRIEGDFTIDLKVEKKGLIRLGSEL